jgi:hypothetical protein
MGGKAGFISSGQDEKEAFVWCEPQGGEERSLASLFGANVAQSSRHPAEARSRAAHAKELWQAHQLRVTLRAPGQDEYERD